MKHFAPEVNLAILLLAAYTLSFRALQLVPELRVEPQSKMQDETNVTSGGASDAWDARCFAKRWLRGDFNDGSIFNRLSVLSLEQLQQLEEALGGHRSEPA